VKEPKPNWYKALQEDPLHNHSFSMNLAARIKDEAVRSGSSSRKNLNIWLSAGVVSLVLLGFVFVRMYAGFDFLMKPKVQLEVTPTNLISIQPTLAPTPTFRPTPQPMFNGRYLVHNGFYYDMTDAVIPLDQIGEQLGTVSRIGDWAMKKEWDTNQFTPSSKIYAIKGVSPEERLAVRAQVRSPKSKESSYDYQEVRSVEAVEAFDPSIVFGAKADKEEVEIAIENIRKVNPFLYEFSHLSSPIELFGVSFSDQFTADTSVYGTHLTYLYPLADVSEVHGFIEVSEYSEEMKQQHTVSNSIFSNRTEIVKSGDKMLHSEHEVNEADLKVIREFDTGNLHWKDYGDQTYVAKLDDRYYEIKLQGKLSDEQLIELLSHFGPANLNE
jgi:hypothetical protein